MGCRGRLRSWWAGKQSTRFTRGRTKTQAGSTCYNWRVSPSISHEVNHVTWEEVPVCGVCGSVTWRPAGAVCQRRFAVCLECGVRRLYDRVAESSLGLLYGDYYPGADPSAAQLEAQLRNPTFRHRRLRLA